MTFTRTALVLAMTTFVASTVLAQKITTEFEPGTDLRSYKTFTWIKQPNVSDPILKQRIVDDVNAQLTAKGYRLVADGGDLGVAAHVATRTERTLNTFYDGFGGGWRWGGGFGTATTMVDSYQEGTLVVDLFDCMTKRAIWRGTAEQELSSDPQKETSNIAKATEKMFKKFPA
jgi:hypothetical protein